VLVLPLLLATSMHVVAAAPAAAGPDLPADPAAVLHRWDERRSAAWAAGDLRALGRLYVAGSAAGRADVAMLRAWRARGLRVEALEVQVLRVDVRRRVQRRVALVVTDRLVGATAVGPGVREPLPTDRPSTRRVVLRRLAGQWRVAAVSPARTTSSTVRSEKE
jgi:hypothetical protein